MRKLGHDEIVARQQKRALRPFLPISVILNNIRSLHNVGSIFRTCDGAGVEKLWLGGITGAPPQPQISKTALGAEGRVPWEHCACIPTVIEQYKKNGYTIVMLEQSEGSIPYYRFSCPGPACLVIGNEINGVAQDVAGLCDAAIEIEMRGIKNSLNVAVAFGIAVYHLQSNYISRIKEGE